MTDVIDAEELKRIWAEADRLEIESQFQALLSNPRGRKFLFYLLGLGQIGKNPFEANALKMSFNCGELNVGQRILADILSVNPDMYIMMQREANDEHRTREQSLHPSSE